MTLPHRPAAVAFDMDGLIFDTERLYRSSFVSAAVDCGYVLGEDVCRRTAGLTWVQSRAVLLDHFGAGFPADTFFERVVRHFDRLADAQLELKPGVVQLLDLLDRLRLPRCIATSSSHATVQSHLAVHGLTNRFDVVIAHGDYLASKPSPEPFLTAARRLGVDPALCLALEDSHNGVRAAHAAGMMTIMVPDLLKPTEEMRAKCVRVSDTLHDVCELIESMGAVAAQGRPSRPF